VTDNIPDIQISKIEEMLSSSRFDTTTLRRASSHRFEGKRAIPMMTVSFHRLLFDTGMVPTPDEYLSEYERENSHFLSSMSDDDMGGIRYRVMRAYPSLIRDIHFVCGCREIGCPAIRTVRDDIAGIDARIPIENGEVKVRLYYDSPRSKSHRMMKAFAHVMGPDHHDLGLSKDNSIRIGDFFLYSPSTIRSFLTSVGVEEGNLRPDS
jgi:hypothetical protein